MTPKFRSHPDVSKRWRWLPKSELVDLLNLRPGMNVAEIGPGAGALGLDVTEKLGPEGNAFAIESPDQAAGFPPASCDRVLMANLCAGLPDPETALKEARRLLRDDGRLIVVEWHAHAQSPDAPATRIALREMVHLLEHNSWDIHRHGDLGQHCYFLEAAASDESVQS